jgi:hypothetical protein
MAQGRIALLARTDDVENHRLYKWWLEPLPIYVEMVIVYLWARDLFTPFSFFFFLSLFQFLQEALVS